MQNESPVLRVKAGSEVTDDGGERPAFYLISLRFDAVENDARTRAEGRKAFDRVLMLRTHYAGSPDTLDRALKSYDDSGVGTVQDDRLWGLFGEIATKFEQHADMLQTGTPLAVLGLDVAGEASLRAANVSTVEMLADVPDHSLGGLGSSARALRDRARVVLARADAVAPLAAAQEAARVAGEELAEMKAEMAELRAQMARRDDENEPAPRRRRKEA